MILKRAYIYRAYGYVNHRSRYARRTHTAARFHTRARAHTYTDVSHPVDSLMNLSSAMKRQTVLIAASGIARRCDLPRWIPEISAGSFFDPAIASVPCYLRLGSGPTTRDKRASLTFIISNLHTHKYVSSLRTRISRWLNSMLMFLRGGEKLFIT